MSRYILTALILLNSIIAKAQQWEGMHGLIHVPDAELDSVGDLRVGAHFVNKEMLPSFFSYEDNNGEVHKYNTLSYYICVTPLSWISVSYTCVLFKNRKGLKDGYSSKDRHLDVKLKILRERKYWPSIAIGVNDIIDSYQSIENGQYRFASFYGVASKHIDLSRHELGVTLGYRKYRNNKYVDSGNDRFTGLFGGVTYRPSFCRNLRFLTEFDGTHVNAGADILLWKHLCIQMSMINCQYFCGGISFSHDLFSR